MAEAITTARVAHEIPGITHFERRKPVFRPDSKERAPSSLVISELRKEEINEFVKVMHAGIDSQAELSEVEKVVIKDRRSEHFYANALRDPKATVLAAKDKTGKIVGGLHGEEYRGPEDRIDGHNIGYVLFVAKDPVSKEKGVGQSLYSAYEQKLVGLGASFMMAAVDHANQGSLNFHERVGMNYVYLEKTPQPKEDIDPARKSPIGEISTNRWYFKKIGETQDDLPVIEADYLSSGLAMTASIASAAMFREGLDDIDIQVKGKSQEGRQLINIVAPNARARRDFEAVMADVASIEGTPNMSDVFSVAFESAKKRALRYSIIKD